MTETKQIDLAAIGLNQEELQTRVVRAICDQLLTAESLDEDGEPFCQTSKLGLRLNAAVREATDARVQQIAQEHIVPRVSELIENVRFQETNKWGEPKTEGVTFREYLVKTAENWLTEKVNFEGKSKEEARGYSWSAAQTRIASMIHRHLHYEIENAMKKALATADSAIAEGIAETVKLKLAEISKGLTIIIGRKK